MIRKVLDLRWKGEIAELRIALLRVDVQRLVRRTAAVVVFVNPKSAHVRADLEHVDLETALKQVFGRAQAGGPGTHNRNAPRAGCDAGLLHSVLPPACKLVRPSAAQAFVVLLGRRGGHLVVGFAPRSIS